MTRYIDADVLKDDIAALFERNEKLIDKWLANCVDDVIDEQPTADVIERKVGKWIMDEHPHDGDCRCSCCWVAIDQMHERNHKLLNILTGGRWWSFYKFCPECGAEMIGKE